MNIATRCVGFMALLLFFFSQPVHCQERPAALGLYGGFGLPVTSGNLNDFFKYELGGTMSLNYYKNKMAYFISISGTAGKLKHDILSDDGNIWEKGKEASFFSYGLNVGYNIYPNIRFRITPFAGLILSECRPSTKEMKEYPYLKQFDVNPQFSPAIGLNITYRFITKNTFNEYGTGFCFGINARALYIPWAVRGDKVPYKGDLCYFSLGIVMEILNTY